MNGEQAKLSQEAHIRQKYITALKLFDTSSEMLKVIAVWVDRWESEGAEGEKEVHKMFVDLKDLIGNRNPNVSELYQIKELLITAMKKNQASISKAMLLEDWYLAGLPAKESVPAVLLKFKAKSERKTITEAA